MVAPHDAGWKDARPPGQGIVAIQSGFPRSQAIDFSRQDADPIAVDT